RTSCYRDWSSDVCSSDLPRLEGEEPRDPGRDREGGEVQGARRGDERRLVARLEGARDDAGAGGAALPPREEGVGDESPPGAAARSEERREGRSVDVSGRE